MQTGGVLQAGKGERAPGSLKWQLGGRRANTSLSGLFGKSVVKDGIVGRVCPLQGWLSDRLGVEISWLKWVLSGEDKDPAGGYLENGVQDVLLDQTALVMRTLKSGNKPDTASDASDPGRCSRE